MCLSDFQVFCNFSSVSEDDLVAHEAKIKIDYLGASLGVRLGFLQIKHIYEVRFKINDELGNDVIFDQLENIHVKIESAESLKEGLENFSILKLNIIIFLLSLLYVYEICKT